MRVNPVPLFSSVSCTGIRDAVPNHAFINVPSPTLVQTSAESRKSKKSRLGTMSRARATNPSENRGLLEIEIPPNSDRRFIVEGELAHHRSAVHQFKRKPIAAGTATGGQQKPQLESGTDSPVGFLE